MMMMMTTVLGDLNRLLDTNSLLHSGTTDARRFNGRLVDANGLFDRRSRTEALRLDCGFVDTDCLLDDGAVQARCFDSGLVDANGLLERRRGGAASWFDGGLGYADVLTVTGLVAGTIFTLDLVDGRIILVGERLAVVMRLRVVVMVVVTVSVDFNVSVGVGRASRPVHTTGQRAGLLVVWFTCNCDRKSKTPPGSRSTASSRWPLSLHRHTLRSGSADLRQNSSIIAPHVSTGTNPQTVSGRRILQCTLRGQMTNKPGAEKEEREREREQEQEQERAVGSLGDPRK